MCILSKILGVPAILMILLTQPVLGQINSVDISGLTEAQKAALVAQAENMKQQIVQKASAETVNEWIGVGKNLSLAITTVAKDLGIAADKFTESTTGKITVAAILWIMLGKDIVQLAIGLLLFIIGLPLWVYFFRNLCVIKNKTLTPVEGQWKRKKEITYYKEGEVDATRWVMLVLLVLSIIGIMIIIFA